MKLKFDYCGNICDSCKEVNDSNQCNIKLCAIHNHVLNCAHCLAFPCNLIKPIIKKYPDAKANLINYKESLNWRMWKII